MNPKPTDAVTAHHDNFGVSLRDADGRQFAYICQPQKLQREPDSFRVRRSGSIGQEIIGPDGKVYAWTTDEAKAAHICNLLIAFKNVQDRKSSDS